MVKVLGDIPYIRSGSDVCQPRKPLGTRTVPYPHANCAPAAPSPAASGGDPASAEKEIIPPIPDGLSIADLPRVFTDPEGRDEWMV